jgi:catalase
MIPTEQTADVSERVLDGLTANFGRAPGRRAAHAKGVVAYGTFTADPKAPEVSRARHFAGDPVDVVARFSNFPGGAPGPDVAPGSNPRGLAVQFRLPDGSTTDLLAHSIDGFPGRTTEDFADFLAAIAPGGPGPEEYLGAHPAAAAFVSALQAHRPPESYATLRYFGVNAFRFHNAAGLERAGRYVWEPLAGERFLPTVEEQLVGTDYLADELAVRVPDEGVSFLLNVTLAAPGDTTDDANAHWPPERPRVPLGTLRLDRLAADSDGVQQGLFFDPVRLVDGITVSDDPLLLGRTRTYPLSLIRRHMDDATGRGADT